MGVVVYSFIYFLAVVRFAENIIIYNENIFVYNDAVVADIFN